MFCVGSDAKTYCSDRHSYSALGVLEATGSVSTVLTLRSKTSVPLAVAPIQFGPSGSLGRFSPLSAVNRHVRS